MKQVEVSILGQGYILACPEGGEARLAAAVASVDREMSAIRDAGKVRARERIAVLAALNLAYQSGAPTAAESGLGQSLPAQAPAAPDQDPAPRGWDEARAATLIARLDEVLGDDGHLL